MLLELRIAFDIFLSRTLVALIHGLLLFIIIIHGLLLFVSVTFWLMCIIVPL